MLSFLKWISTKNQIVRYFSTNYEDLVNQKLTKRIDSPERRLQKVERLETKIFNKRVFSLDQSIEERKECVLLEIELLKENGVRVPSEITELNWKLLTSDPNKVVDNLIQLSKKEYYKERDKERKNELVAIRDIAYPEHEYNNYIFGKHTRLGLPVQAFLRNNPAVVFDFQFEQSIMFENKLSSLLTQLKDAYGSNAKSLDPFRLYFANFKKGGKFDTEMKDKSIILDDLMIIESEKSYLESFPKDKLVYLSPNSRNVMKKFDEDKVYIIGVFSDGTEKSPNTKMQADKDGIITQRFPVDFRLGNKDLPIDQVMDILIHLRTTRNWTKAFDASIPELKIKSKQIDDATYVEKYRLRNL